MHNGGLPLDGAADCLTSLLDAGKVLVINSNSSSTSEDTRKRLVEEHQLPMLEGCAVVTSGTQMIDMVKEQGWTGKRAILFGWDVPRPELDSLELNYAADVEKEGDVAFLIAQGCCGITTNTGDVLVGCNFQDTGDLDAVEHILAAAAEQKIPMLVANQDVISRTADGGTAYRPGLIADRYDELGGTTIRFGKPGKACFEKCLAELSDRGVTDAARIIHVGDSLHHDVAGANNAGLASLFIAGGVHAEALGVVPGDTPDETAVAALYENEGHQPTHAVPYFRW